MHPRWNDIPSLLNPTARTNGASVDFATFIYDPKAIEDVL